MQSWIGVVRDVGGRRRLILPEQNDRAVDWKNLPEAGTWVRARGGAVEVLAEAGTGLADLYRLVSKAHVPLEASEQAREEAEQFLEDWGASDPSLVDLTRLPLVPIDEVTSKDLDQAVAIEPDGEGWCVWYALADASWFIRPGSALYDEALARGSTYYLPGLVVPMLPRVLSEDKISLNAGEDRRAMVFELHLDAEGVCVERKIHRAKVHCRHKLDFHGVQRFLDGERVDWDEDVQASLRLLPEVGKRRIALAAQRNVIRYRRTEVDVALKHGRFVAMDGPRNAVERYNEQISLLTNIEGAKFLLDGDTEHDHVQPIYRVHDAPGTDRLAELATLTKAVSRLHGLGPEWVWDPASEGLSSYLDRLPDEPLARAIHRQAMVTNRPSVFASIPGEHHGVGAAVYGRFTAPMREVVGIFLHQEVWEKLAGRAMPAPEGYDGETLRAKVVEVANRSRQLQRRFTRDANRMVLDDLFEADLDGGAPSRPGLIMGITATRVHVQLLSPRVDVKIYVPHLDRSWQTTLTLGAQGASLSDVSGVRLRVGDEVRVAVVSRDLRRDRWELSIDPALGQEVVDVGEDVRHTVRE